MKPSFFSWGRNKNRPLSFSRRFFVLTTPLLFQDVLRMLFGNIDLMMISRTGEAETAACGLVNAYLLIFYMVMLAFRFAMTPLSAQYYGAKRKKTFEHYITSGAAFLFGLGLICALLFYYLLPSLLNTWGVNSEVQTAAMSYAGVLAFGIPFFGMAISFENALRVTYNVRLALFSKVMALFLNTGLNYILIYGCGSIPALGIFGAGIATFIALFAESLLSAFLCFKVTGILRFHGWPFIYFEKTIWRQTLRGVLPIMPQEVLWSGAMLMYSKAFASYGTFVLANYNIAKQIELFSESGCWAFMMGTGIVIGRDLGANKLHRAKIKARVILQFGLLFSALLAIVLWFSLPLAIFAYNLSEEAYQFIKSLAALFLIITPLKMLGLIILAGILRSGGDFVLSAFCEIFSMWCYAVPLTLFCSLYIGCSPQVTFAIVCSEWLLKTLLLWLRYKKGQWLKNLVIA